LASKIDDQAVGKVTSYQHDRPIAGPMEPEPLRLDFNSLKLGEIHRRVVRYCKRRRQR
jgi:hypothetical protein